MGSGCSPYRKNMKKLYLIFTLLLALSLPASAQVPSLLKTVEALDWSMSEKVFAKAYPVRAAGTASSAVVRSGPHSLRLMPMMEFAGLTLEPQAVFEKGVLAEIEMQVPSDDATSMSALSATLAEFVEKETGLKPYHSEEDDVYVFSFPAYKIVIVDDVVFIRKQEETVVDNKTIKLKAQ